MRIGTGTLVSMALWVGLIASGTAGAEDGKVDSGKMDEATAQAIGRTPVTMDPEKDTVALELSEGRRTEAAAVPVQVGQGLRPDGTELAPSETPRPWLIRQ